MSIEPKTCGLADNPMEEDVLTGAAFPRRVAVISDFSLATLGGAEAAYREQIKALAGAGMDVLAMSPHSAGLSELGRLEKVATLGLPVLFRVPGLGFPVARNTPALRGLIERALTEHAIEVVHLHSEFGIAAATHQVARELRIPVVQTVHCWLLTDWPIQRLLSFGVPIFHRWATGVRRPHGRFGERVGDSAMRAMTVALARQATRVVAPSVHIGEDLREAGLGPVDVIPNTVTPPVDAHALTAAGLGGDEGPLRVFWFGRCVAEKRLVPFVHSARDAIERLGPGRLQIDVAGEGDQLAKAKATAEGIDDIRFHGRLSPEQVGRQLKRCHVTALTSVGFDNQPMMVVESISALRPVIYCDPRLNEGLDGGAGLEAFGEDSVLTELLVALASDRTPVLEASRAALLARADFSPRTFAARAAVSYGRALEPRIRQQRDREQRPRVEKTSQP